MKKDSCKLSYLLAILSLVSANFFLSAVPADSQTSTRISATVAVGVCGNNIVEFGEDCDGSALNGETCLSQGFDGGTLSCNLGCDFNLSECVDLGPDEGSIVFSGRSYPFAVIRILKDGQIAATTAAGADGNFETTLSDLTIGSYLFSVYALDANGEQSKTLTYQRDIVKDEITEVEQIITPPTLQASKDEVKQGDKITLSGYAVPSSSIQISLVAEGDSETFTAVANSNGYFSYKFDTDSLDEDDYTATARNEVSGYPLSDASVPVYFEVKEEDEEEDDQNKTATDQCDQPGDVNTDCRVNQIDFSIFLDWRERSNFPPEVDLNGNNQVDLGDLSIMMYYWTG